MLARFIAATILFVAVLVCGFVTAGSAFANVTPIYSGTSWFNGIGVNVCSDSGSNGSDPVCGGETHVGSSAQYGYWQCVELAQRFYQKQGWHSGTFTNVDYAYQIYDNAAANGFTRQANGSISSIVPGDMIVHGSSDTSLGLVTSPSTYAGHVAIVDYITGTTIHAVQQNAGSATITYTLSGGTLNGGSGNGIVGIVHSPNNTGSTNSASNIVFTNGGGQTFANANPSSSAWTQLTNSTQAISASGNYVAFIDGCGAAWATNNFASIHATRLTPCSGATAIAIGSQGNVVFIDSCGSAHASDSYTVSSSWVTLTACNGAVAIAAGGGGTGEVAVINSCGALNATKDYQNWVAITGCNGAQRVAIGPTGTLAFVNGCGAMYATLEYSNASNWVNISPCGGSNMIAVGANKSLSFTDSCSSVHSTNTFDIASSWVTLTGCNGATAIAMGTAGETGIINGCGALNITADFQQWINITSCNGATKVAVS